MAIGRYRDNAELIVACRDLGYIGGRVLDPTWGLGRFWTRWQPDGLVATDLDPARGRDGVADFTALPHPDRSFDTVVFDPPYKLNGTPSSGGPASSDSDYGVATVASWRDRMALCMAGIDECGRVAAGHLLVKCQDQVCSGKVRWQTHEFAAHAVRGGVLQLVDRLELVSYRPQPAGRRQVHARRNHSTMLVFRVVA